MGKLKKTALSVHEKNAATWQYCSRAAANLQDNKRSAVNYLMAQDVREIWDARDTLGTYTTQDEHDNLVRAARKNMRRLGDVLEEPTARQRRIRELRSDMYTRQTCRQTAEAIIADENNWDSLCEILEGRL